MAHLSEREAVFARTDLFAAALAHAPGAVTIGEAEREVAALEKTGTLHGVNVPGAEDSLATAKTVAEERETVASMRAGQGRGAAPMRSWQVQEHLNKGPLEELGIHGRPEERREADPVGEGPGGGRSGLRRQRQDHDARPGKGAGGEEGLPDGGTRAVRLRRANAGLRSQDRKRDPPKISRAERRRC